MLGCGGLGMSNVRDGPGDFQHAVKAACGKMQLLGGSIEQAPADGIELTDAVYIRESEVRGGPFAQKTLRSRA